VAFSPADRPRVVVSEDGSAAAIREPFRITLVDLPVGTAASTLELDPAAQAIDVGWVAPTRLLVLSRYAAHSTVQLFDPRRTRPTAELWIEARLRLVATTGAHALIVGTVGSAVLFARDAAMTAVQWPGPEVPTVAGSAAGRFVVVVGDSIELWDPSSMRLTRRLPAPGHEVTRIGGNLRRLWMTTQEDTRRIDVLELSDDGRTSRRMLPERIESVAAHSDGNLLACVTVSGELFLVDLERDEPPRPISIAGLDRVESAAIVGGEPIGVLAARGDREIQHVVVGAGPRPRKVGVTRARWRDDVVEWARDVEAGHVTQLPPAPPIDVVVDRLALPARLRPCVFLLYGVALAGAQGATPIDVRRVLGPTWDDALGRGALAALGVASYPGSRVCLSRPLRHMLDELPAATGTLIGDPSEAAPHGRFVVVAHEPAESFAGIAERCLPRVGGAILVARSGASIFEVFVEARVRGATPLLRAPNDISGVPLGPAILVVGDAAAATRLGLPSL
jgi:hypothetical protein